MEHKEGGYMELDDMVRRTPTVRLRKVREEAHFTSHHVYQDVQERRPFSAWDIEEIIAGPIA